MRSALLCSLFLLSAWSCSGNLSDVTVYKVPKEKPAALPAQLAAAPAPKSAMTWDIPKGWEKKPPAPMRVASFAAGNAEVSIVSLPGEAGGVLANINRWRGQLGLPPIAEKDLASATRLVDTAAGRVLVVDFTGGPKRMVAGLLSANDESWFFKMTGEEKSVANALPAFNSFLGSLRLEAN